MKRRKYKRRRYKRRRTTMRGRRRYTRRRIPKYDEVKVYAAGISNHALKINWPGVADTTQYAEAFVTNNILNSITQGTDFFNRIGTQIYVLSVKVKFNAYMCSPDEHEINTGIIRVNVGEPVGTAGVTNFTNYYRSAGRDRTLMPLNRKYYTFHYDRTYTVESGYPNRLADVDDALMYSGAIRHFEFNIPINRRVEYTTTNAVKNQRDQLSIFATPMAPNPTNTRQVFCTNWSWSIYYVDA